MKFSLFHKELIVPVILSVFLFLSHRNLSDNTILLVFIGNICAIGVGIYWFLHGAITEITAHLGIYCFTLKKRVKNE